MSATIPHSLPLISLPTLFTKRPHSQQDDKFPETTMNTTLLTGALGDGAGGLKKILNHDSQGIPKINPPSSPKFTTTNNGRSSGVNINLSTPRSVPPIPSLLPRDSLEIIPPVGHLVAHLKLIRCFAKLQSCMTPENWELYCKNALRRFIWFVSILKHKLKHRVRYTSEQSQLKSYHYSLNAKSISHLLGSMLPPIDILYVWYTLLLRTTSFYEMGVRNLFLEFVFYPFPLLSAGNSILSQNYKYNPPYQMIESFGAITDRKISWMQPIPDPSNTKNIINEIVPIVCPGCFLQLSKVQLSKLQNLDQLGSCKCRFQGNLTLSQLRKRQLYADIVDDKPLPLLFQTVSQNLYEDGANVNELDASIKAILKDGNHHNTLKQAGFSMSDFFEQSGLDVNYRRVFFDYYANISCISCTVPISSPIKVADPYFSIREEFMANTIYGTQQIDLFNRLENGETWFSNACEKYSNFFMMILESFRSYSLVPLFDIDLVWQTHKLSMYRYIEYCKLHCHKNVIDITDALLEAFSQTCRLYKAVRRLNYTDCVCKYCFHASKMRRSSRYLVNSDPYLDCPPCVTVSNCGTSIVRTSKKPKEELQVPS